MILLLGGSGFVASAFAAGLARRNLAYQRVSRQRCDYTRLESLTELLRQTKPELVINAAGYTGKPNVEACETHKADCLLGNAVLPGVVREACQEYNIPWGHVSSGCIFNGSPVAGGGFRETDPPNFCFRAPPCSFYSGCKALGEECLQGADQVFIWRLRIPFQALDSDRNYLSKVMRYDRLLDVENSIADLDEYVDACLHCWINRVPFGIYNIVNSGSVWTREVVSLIQRHLKIERDFQFFRDEAEFLDCTTGVPRSSCLLDNTKLLQTGFEMRDARDAITTALLNWQSSR